MRPRKYQTAAERTQARVLYNQRHYAKRTASAQWDFTGLWDRVHAGQRFACLYVDPPWQYANKATRSAAEKHYPTLSLDALRQLPVRNLAAPKAHLHLWTTNGHLPEALDLMQAWGFAYKLMYTWCKKEMGMGNYWRSSTEHMLFGVRGGLPFLAHDEINWLLTSRGQYSRKPDQVRRKIEKVSPGPYLELFARETVPGWTVWGNDLAPTLFTPAAD